VVVRLESLTYGRSRADDDPPSRMGASADAVKKV
jgi:hypothetical protein